MASEILPRRSAGLAVAPAEAASLTVWRIVTTIFSPLASLKLTVALMAMAIFLIMAGTLAQIDMDIWQVMRDYFRTPLALIDLSIYFPRSWHVPGRFYFPGGFTIGGLMLLNLLAAHTVRFKIQARGSRLWAGLALIAGGAGLTWLVIASGSNREGLQGVPLFEWGTLWSWFKVGLAALSAAAIFALFKIDSARKIERVILVVVSVALATLVGWLYFSGASATLGDASMRILWQLIKGGLAGLVLLTGCLLVFRKRAGIVLLHAGIGLMMTNEMVVYGLHEEGQMQIHEGQTVNYVQDIRAVELAVIDPLAPDTDDVIVVPQSRLAEGQTIRDAELPFDVEIVEYFKNSTLSELKSGETSPADAGTGLQFAAVAARPGAGTDTSGEVDLPSAYVRLIDKHSGKPLGTYLVGALQSAKEVPEKVTVDGKTYDLYLRFKRTYKPYTVHLDDVRTDKYMGTNTPQNYSSDIRLVDADRHVDRNVHIWMNNPLRYAGETFYQSGAPEGTDITILQVVTNTGWMLPYVACMIVAIGMLGHFSIVLTRFLKRQDAADAGGAGRKGGWGKAQRAPERGAPPSRSTADWFLPLAVVGCAGVLMLSAAMPRRAKPEHMDLAAFGRLPVMYEGRIKPFDTLARNSLRVMSDSESFEDSAGTRQPAIRWLLDVINDPPKAAEYKVIRIQNLEVLDTLGLKRRKGYRYAIDEFRDHMDEFEKQVQAAHDTNAADRSVFQKKILELDNRLRLYMTLSTSFSPPSIRPDHAAADVLEAMQRQQQMFSRLAQPLVVPPASGEGGWEPFSLAWTKAFAQTNLLNQEANPATKDVSAILVAYAQGDAARFNEAVAEYQEFLAAHTPSDLNAAKVGFEEFFNHTRPFFWATWMYVVAFVLAALGWLGVWSRPLNRAAFALVAFTFAVHTFALVSRIYISGRPPVTNLYSAAVFIGWGAVLLGMILEGVFRMGAGNIVASVAGFATLLIADRLAGDGDTFTVLQAVLDTQFWLATHVTCITLGYATTFMAGLLGVLYILAGVLTPRLSPKLSHELARMIYGILCFAIFFSFVGTVLGGLWADDSWGRFWGWDPKENGALIIVLWNALVLHARWDGMVKDRGLAALAVLGNVTVSWSMFGVNQLSVGLHSYGFTEGIALALVIFVASQLAVVGLSLLPRRLWLSARA